MQPAMCRSTMHTPYRALVPSRISVLAAPAPALPVPTRSCHAGRVPDEIVWSIFSIWSLSFPDIFSSLSTLRPAQPAPPFSEWRTMCLCHIWMRPRPNNHAIAIADGMVALSLSAVDLVRSSTVSGSAGPTTSKKKSKRNCWADAGKGVGVGIYGGHEETRRCKGTMMQGGGA